MSESSHDEFRQQERLLLAIAEHLKLPLLQIARQAELGDADLLPEVELTAERAIHLIDSYLLAADQQELQIQPVTISSVLYDAADKLTAVARRYNCDLELELDGKYGPVMAQRDRLEAALITLGQSLIEMQPSGKRSRLIMSAYRAQGAVKAGIFGGNPELSQAMFRKAGALYGQASQPLPVASNMNGAGIYVADSLFSAMSAHLHVARHHKLTGLAASFQPSAQLQLV